MHTSDDWTAGRASCGCIAGLKPETALRKAKRKGRKERQLELREGCAVGPNISEGWVIFSVAPRTQGQGRQQAWFKEGSAGKAIRAVLFVSERSEAANFCGAGKDGIRAADRSREDGS